VDIRHSRVDLTEIDSEMVLKALAGFLGE